MLICLLFYPFLAFPAPPSLHPSLHPFLLYFLPSLAHALPLFIRWLCLFWSVIHRYSTILIFLIPSFGSYVHSSYPLAILLISPSYPFKVLGPYTVQLHPPLSKSADHPPQYRVELVLMLFEMNEQPLPWQGRQPSPSKCFASIQAVLPDQRPYTPGSGRINTPRTLISIAGLRDEAVSQYCDWQCSNVGDADLKLVPESARHYASGGS